MGHLCTDTSLDGLEYGKPSSVVCFPVENASRVGIGSYPCQDRGNCFLIENATRVRIGRTVSGSEQLCLVRNATRVRIGRTVSGSECTSPVWL